VASEVIIADRGQLDSAMICHGKRLATTVRRR